MTTLGLWDSGRLEVPFGSLFRCASTIGDPLPRRPRGKVFVNLLNRMMHGLMGQSVARNWAVPLVSVGLIRALVTVTVLLLVCYSYSCKSCLFDRWFLVVVGPLGHVLLTNCCVFGRVATLPGRWHWDLRCCATVTLSRTEVSVTSVSVNMTRSGRLALLTCCKLSFTVPLE